MCVCVRRGTVTATARSVLAKQKRRSVPEDNGSGTDISIWSCHQIRLFHIPKLDNITLMRVPMHAHARAGGGL